MSAAPHLRAVASRPLFGVENEVRSVVDRLAVLDAVMTGAVRGLGPEQCRAVCRLIGEALHEAQTVEAAWDAEHGRRA